ncbi:pyrroline-5-carboxylate reductase [Patescibacteria group bacterium]|nr:pyrroline-5-carboxylate reductase [Patescibacteria group bacterium]
MKHVTIIGPGNLGIALATGMQKNGYVVTLKCKDEQQVIEKQQQFPECTFTEINEDATSDAHVIIFAVQPKDLEETIADMDGHIWEEHIIISVVAGITINSIKKFLRLPNPHIYRAMPNTASAIGQSMTAISTGTKQKYVQELFKSIGSVVCIDELQFPQFTVLSGSGVAIALKFIRAYMQAGIQAGFNEHTSLELAREVLIGAGNLVREKQQHPEVLIDAVTTPNGCTITTLLEMDSRGFTSSLVNAIEKGISKAKLL